MKCFHLSITLEDPLQELDPPRNSTVKQNTYVAMWLSYADTDQTALAQTSVVQGVHCKYQSNVAIFADFEVNACKI